MAQKQISREKLSHNDQDTHQGVQPHADDDKDQEGKGGSSLVQLHMLPQTYPPRNCYLALEWKITI